MKTGLILNGFVCIIVALVIFWVSIIIFSQKNKTLHEKLLFAFWSVAGITWLLVGSGLFFYYNGLPSYDLLINKYAIQPLIYIHSSFGVAYAVYRIIKNKTVTKISLALFLLLSATGIYFLFTADSFHVSHHTFFSVEYNTHFISSQIFQYLVLLGVLLIVADLLRHAVMKIKRSAETYTYFFTGLSILIYSVIGFFDNQGVNATWIMVLFRVTIILGVLLTYIAYTWEEIHKRKFD